MRIASTTVVGTCMWMGAASFLAFVEVRAPELLVHGNPIGIRCVLGVAGAILGLPVGGLLTQLYSTCKATMSAERLVNGVVGLVPTLAILHLLVGPMVLAQHIWGHGPGWITWAWGLAVPCMCLCVIWALGPDSRGVLRRWWPSFDETIDVVRQALAPARARVPDLRFWTRHQVTAIAHTGFLEGAWLLPAPLVTRLRVSSQCGPWHIRYRAQRALASLNQLYEACPGKLVLRTSQYPPGWGPTRTMVAEAILPGAGLLLSRPLASPPPGESLLIPTCVRALRSPYQVGDSLELPLLGHGRHRGQARGTLEDGTLVLVRGGAPYTGTTIRIEVVHVLYSVTGVLVFARATPIPPSE